MPVKCGTVMKSAFRALPEGTITFKDNFGKGRKRSKERTALVAYSMIGEKKNLLVIGKYVFRGVSLPVEYETNSNELEVDIS